MRRTSSLIVAALLLCSPAMAGTQVLLIYDPDTAALMRIVIPDEDKELDDPAYKPKGTAQMTIPLATYRAAASVKGLEALLPKPVLDAAVDAVLP